jgi:hypothetical protein
MNRQDVTFACSLNAAGTGFDKTEGFRHGLSIATPNIGQLDASMRPVKQRNPEALLKHAYLVADGRGGEVQLSRCRHKGPEP